MTPTYDDAANTGSDGRIDPERMALPAMLLIEDDDALGSMTAEMLEDGYRVDWVRTGTQARESLKAHVYDVLVVDRRLPDMDGLDMVRTLRRNGLTIPALMLTALSSVEDIVDGLDGGANDYMTKPFHFAELEARLRVLMRGYRAAVAASPIGDWLLKPGKSAIEDPDGRTVVLTNAETKLLHTLASSPDHVFSRDELLHAVFSADSDGSTVDVYVSYIRAKTTRGIIETVRGRGYRIGAPLAV